jgi:transposase
MRFAELTDEQWDFIKPHIPPQPIVGRKRADDRKTINGILYVLVTGCRWHDMPRRYGSYQTAWRRLNWWSKIGVWNKILSFCGSGIFLRNRQTQPGNRSS